MIRRAAYIAGFKNTDEISLQEKWEEWDKVDRYLACFYVPA